MPSLPDTASLPPGLPELLQGEVLLRHLQVSVADDQGDLLYVNERMCEACGYRQEELLRHNYSMLATGRHPPEFFAELWQTVQAGSEWHGEMSNRRKDGSEYWIELTVVPLPAEGNLPRRYVGLGSDITRIVEAEQQLRSSEARFRGLTETISAACST